MKFAAILLTMFILCAPAMAADVDGKWTGNLDMAGTPLPVSFTFKAEGEKLTGTTLGIDGSEVAITDGKVSADGKTISFKVTFDFGGMPFVLDYKGAVSPAEIKITGEAAGMPFEVVVKKAAAAAPAPAAK